MKIPFLVLSIAYFLCSCSVQQAANNSVLKDKTGWTTDTLSQGVIWYKYSNQFGPQKAFQNVNVLEFNPHLSSKKAIIAYSKEKDSLSSFAGRYPGSVAGINAAYFLERKDTISYTYVKVNSEVLSTIDVPSSNKFSWKNEGAFMFDNKKQDFKIGYTPSNLKGNNIDNILTSAPVLIDNFKPVGLTFADTSKVNLKKLDYEHPVKHQGIRHPRTALAITRDGHLLLVTVDGRNPKASGMTAAELTSFLQKFFNPKSAINMDGGGSTTMWIKGQPDNGIVNHPTDNKKYDHFGQRRVETVILIQ